jgi:ABC-type transporter Mla subunit MlaD
MNDRNLGYAVILFLIVFVVITGVYLSLQVFAPVHHRNIIFDSANSLNFLKNQDPVRFRGIAAGHIRHIFLKDGKTFVEIETRCPLDIHQGYSIVAEAKGFMGDRYIEIHPGDMRKPLIASYEPLAGTFPLGPAEAVAYTAELKIKVRSLIALTDELKNGSPAKQSLDARFTGMINKIDSISLSLKRLLINSERFAFKNADSLAAAIEKADKLSIKMSSSAPAAVRALENVTVKTKRLLIAADSLSSTCEAFLEQLNYMESGSLSKHINDLQKRIKLIKDLINELQEDGFLVPVKL